MIRDHDGYDDDVNDDAHPGVTYHLQMPFVAVRSKGGAYDDESYIAGWDAAKINGELATHEYIMLTRVIEKANWDQLDLVAMRHGYTMSRMDRGPWTLEHEDRVEVRFDRND